MTTIKLDRRALASLIESDPEFRLELQRNILAEAIRKMMPKDVRELAQIMTPEVTAQMLQDAKMSEVMQEALERALRGRIVYQEAWRTKPQLSEKQKADIQAAVNKITNDAFEKAADQRAAAIVEALEKAEARIEETITRRLKESTDTIFEELVQAEVKRRLTLALGT